jgi:hypothetical protein
MINTSLLRSKIYGTYHSQAEFGRAIGWSSNKICNTLKGKHTLDVNECAELNTSLKLTMQEYMQIFLPLLSPNGVEQQAS